MKTKEPTSWLLFLANLSGRSASTPRVRLWRALKELGAATLRDGVALLPESENHRDKLEKISHQVETDGGTAWLLELPAQNPESEAQFRSSFDRSEAYLALQASMAAFRTKLPQLDESGARRQLRQIEHALEAIAIIDFFPDNIQKQMRYAVAEITLLINRSFSPEEPVAVFGKIEKLDRTSYQGRLWATRQRLWVDRVASAWLIRRFIDTQASFVWLTQPLKCPDNALGFDFDGARFAHFGDRVTFEVLLASFGLEGDAGLIQLGRLVHYLDVGGLAVAEAAGFEAVLAGLRESTVDDDALLDAVAPVLDALYRNFSKVKTP
ncbi:MAG: chromate resistance protein [Gammaproteobacteria bacterium]|nr:chromate resistance protein [Gammaproteobacteria bacterium]